MSDAVPRDFARIFRASDGQQVLACVHDDDQGVQVIFSAKIDGMTIDLGIRFKDGDADKAYVMLDALDDKVCGDKTMEQMRRSLGL